MYDKIESSCSLAITQSQIVAWRQEDEMTSENLNAFVDFAAENPDAIGQIGSKNIAVLVMQQLLELGVPTRTLIKSTRHFDFGNDLLKLVFVAFRGTTKWFEMVDIVYQAAPSFIGEGIWSESTLDQLMEDVETVEYCLTHHRKLLLGYENQLVEFDHDKYWGWKVRWHLAKCDFRRAWDELKRASMGFFVGEPGDVNIVDWDAADYRFPASTALVGTLVEELFAAMLGKELLTAVNQNDHDIHQHGKGQYTTVTPKGREITKEYESKNSKAFHMASKFAASQSRFNTKVMTVDDTGAKILKIDAHFRTLRDEDRRRRVRDRMSK